MRDSCRFDEKFQISLDRKIQFSASNETENWEKVLCYNTAEQRTMNLIQTERRPTVESSRTCRAHNKGSSAS